LQDVSINCGAEDHLADWPGFAPWAVTVPPDITLVPLPPKCPELNVAENVWQFMRENWLSNRIFQSADDLVAYCSEAWNRLIEQPWRIISLALRRRAHRF
jgi:putative transposase